MADHIADEEQLEALKRWWKQYGASLALAVVLGVGSWFGWSQWQSSRESRAQAASLVYEEMMSAIGMTAIEELAPEPLQAIAAKAEQLKKEYGGTQYDRLARLLLARLAKELRLLHAKVALLVVDPSSPLTGGAILGDRVRMTALTAEVARVGEVPGVEAVVPALEHQVRTKVSIGGGRERARQPARADAQLDLQRRELQRG